MTNKKLISSLFIPLVAAAVVLSGCSSPKSGAAESGSESGKIQIVASTNVYGDIAHTIAGDAADVVSIMSDPAQDPHSFEADTRTQLAISKADLLIENGGGYDDFMETLRNAAKNDKALVINAVEISGKDDGSGELNEHVWYDFPTVQKVADQIAADLTKIDPSKKDQFQKNSSDFSSKLAELEKRQEELKATYQGEGVAITEPVPLYMLEVIGLDNKTPAEFSEAVEEGTDVSPKVLNDTLALFSNHEVKLLALNAQTSGVESDQVEKAAIKAGIPVVKVTETVPDGKDYISWMTANLDAVEQALQK